MLNLTHSPTVRRGEVGAPPGRVFSSRAPIMGSGRGPRPPRPCRARAPRGPLSHDGPSSPSLPAMRAAPAQAPATRPSRLRDPCPPPALGSATLRCTAWSPALCRFHSRVLLDFQTAQGHRVRGGGGVGRAKGAAWGGRFSEALFLALVASPLKSYQRYWKHLCA